MCQTVDALVFFCAQHIEFTYTEIFVLQIQLLFLFLVLVVSPFKVIFKSTSKLPVSCLLVENGKITSDLFIVFRIILQMRFWWYLMLNSNMDKTSTLL